MRREIRDRRVPGARNEIRPAIAKARTLDLSSLPEELRKDVADSFGKAAAAFGLMDQINKAEDAMNAHAEAYAPLHQKVRFIEADIRRVAAQIKELKEDIVRVPYNDADRKTEMEAHMAVLEAQRKELQSPFRANGGASTKRFVNC